MNAASKPASPMISTICGSAIPPTCVPSASPPSLNIRFTRFSFMLPSRGLEPYGGDHIGIGRRAYARTIVRSYSCVTRQAQQSRGREIASLCRPHRPRAAGPRRSVRKRLSAVADNDEGPMPSLVSENIVAFVKGVAAEARRVETRCGNGHMVWHVWGDGPALALLTAATARGPTGFATSFTCHGLSP